MAVYSSSNSLAGTQQATTSTYKTQLALTAATATLTRGLIQEIDVGTPGTPADNYLEYDISRQTAAGTSTAVTPVPLDTTSRAAGTVGSANFTAEGTITATSSVFYLALNQRASYRWVAAPGSELVIPAVNLAGLAIRARSAAYTGTVGAMALHIE
jgi:hypothetical protein